MSLSRVVYVAGKYRDKTEWAMINNIRYAERVSLELWAQKENGRYVWDAVITPHKNTERFQGALPDDRWIRGCLVILKLCQAIYMLKNWKQSYGARCEHRLARWLRLEIIYES